ncbi:MULTISPECIES: TetR/AcrR family transcriptional regulator [unclassified Nocardia]|uniref:TetR/AcrR family transcriptional regulator n=1 Tax=unclassified Nocardia TaxID=2637762 RepID=UPI001CE3F258|nr:MULTISPECIES: TetR/AcrR family transcriptional regulator [unclassified Nocardia]
MAKLASVPPNPKLRPHTGRRRNDAARQAILTATTDLLARRGTTVTIGDITAAAGVSRHTIYRWWPSRGMLLLEAMAEWAREGAPAPDTGTLAEDLKIFLTATFAAAAAPPAATLLRAVLAEAQSDSATAELLAAFARDRRGVLHRILERAQARGELAADTDRELVIDQVYGVLWYRLTVARTPLDAETAERLAGSLLKQ